MMNRTHQKHGQRNKNGEKIQKPLTQYSVCYCTSWRTFSICVWSRKNGSRGSHPVVRDPEVGDYKPNTVSYISS